MHIREASRQKSGLVSKVSGPWYRGVDWLQVEGGRRAEGQGRGPGGAVGLVTGCAALQGGHGTTGLRVIGHSVDLMPPWTGVELLAPWTGVDPLAPWDSVDLLAPIPGATSRSPAQGPSRSGWPGAVQGTSPEGSFIKGAETETSSYGSLRGPSSSSYGSLQALQNLLKTS